MMLSGAMLKTLLKLVKIKEQGKNIHLLFLSNVVPLPAQERKLPWHGRHRALRGGRACGRLCDGGGRRRHGAAALGNQRRPILLWDPQPQPLLGVPPDLVVTRWRVATH